MPARHAPARCLGARRLLRREATTRRADSRKGAGAGISMFVQDLMAGRPSGHGRAARAGVGPAQRVAGAPRMSHARSPTLASVSPNVTAASTGSCGVHGTV